jgi:FADH2 O2-dependent halogenase
MPDVDLAIVGSGFGGSLLAMLARRLGLSVMLLEKGAHPRFAIGESTTPLMNLLLEQMAYHYDLPRLLPLTAYGLWQRAYPEVICGLKRGFSYFHHQAGRPFRDTEARENQLLVAASPDDAVADTHWLRSDVDFFLLREAIALNVEYSDHTALYGMERRGEAMLLYGERKGQPVRVSARLIVDATGPRGFLSRILSLPEAQWEGYPATQSLYSHFAGVRRCETMEAFATSETPPYPIDDAALHHVFEGGWMWVLRFNNGITSAGIAVTDGLAEELHLAEGEPAWGRFLQRFPTIAEQFAEAVLAHPFVYAPRLSYRSAVAAGEGWILLPSAAHFVDPLFSTGMPLTLFGIERLGNLLAQTWGTDRFQEGLHHCANRTLSDADETARFLGACYATFPHFARFVAFSMFYFAAASYSEMARRLEKPHLAQRFLAADRADFAPRFAQAGDLLRDSCSNIDFDFAAYVAESIEPLNVAGLADRNKRNWYGVDLNDVVRAARKLDHTPDTMRRILAVAPWAQI